MVQPGGWPLEFHDPEQALQFLEDLRVEFGLETELRIQGLDSLGLPLETEQEFLDLGTTYPTPPTITPRERLTMQVTKAVFFNQAPNFAVKSCWPCIATSCRPERFRHLRAWSPLC